MYLLMALLAQAKGQDQPQGPGFGMFVPLIAMFFFFWLFMMRPAQKQEAQRREMVSKLRKNDRILNQGGIIGVVDFIKEKDDEVVLKGGLRITRSSIVRVFNAEDREKEDKDNKDKDSDNGKDSKD